MKKIVIIGGGIAGLSAGIYAQKYGFESIIYEKHSLVGGQCTGWDRKGYHIDGCIQWLTGTKEGNDLNDLWKEVGALGDVEIIQLDNFGTYEYEGTSITLWKDLDRLQEELIKISPEDADAINKFIKDVIAVQSMEMPARIPVGMMKFTEMIKYALSMIGSIKVMGRLSNQGFTEYAERFKHPALKNMFTLSAPGNYSVIALIFGMGIFSGGNGAIPKGGSKQMALRMEDRYVKLGGKVVCNISAEEIIIENRQAAAVRFSDGTTVKADYVIAACDAKVTFDKLLKGRYNDKKFEMRYNNPADYSLPTSVQVAFGISEDLSSYPTLLTFPTEVYRVGESDNYSVGISNYCYQPDFAPQGCTVIISTVGQTDPDYFYWEKLYKDKVAYRQEKQRIAGDIQRRIETRFPELSGKLSVLDVATPMTYHRYTGAYHGAWMSFMMTTKSKYMEHSGNIKGLKNCFLTGQWLMPPGGLPVAAVTGKFSVMKIAKKEKCLRF